MWDGRLPTLEEQALGPIQAAGEMNMQLDQADARLASIPEYKPSVRCRVSREGIKPKTLAQAIATYERTVVSERARFDAWVEGNEKAISEDAKRGFALFNDKAECSSCHEGWNFTNDGFHDIGLPSADVGRVEIRARRHQDAARVQDAGPARDLAPRPLHARRLAAHARAVIDHYDRAASTGRAASDLMKPLGLTAQDKADLVAFLKTLTSDLGPTAVPVLPR